MLGYSFPKGRDGNDTIRKNWEVDMRHFSDHFTPLQGTFSTEEFLLLKIDDDHYIQGYADLIRDDGICQDGSKIVSILDWKTSSLYSKEDFKHAARQLYIYGMAKEQQGYKVKELSWVFLKYAEVTYKGKKRRNAKKESEITKVIERRKISETLYDVVEDKLYQAGYSDIDVETYLANFLKYNSFDKIPKPIASQFYITEHIKTIPYTEEGKADTMNFIVESIRNFENKGTEDSQDWEHRSFTKTSKTGRVTEDTFYCQNLCNYGHTCKYFQAYKDSLEEAEEDEDEGWF